MTIKRTVQNVNMVGVQSFNITIHGLSPGTRLRAFFDGVVVPSSQLKQVVGNTTGSQLVLPSTGQLITDSNGNISFIFYYTDNIDKNNYTLEESYYSFASTNTGKKSFVVIDYASTSDSTQVFDKSTGQLVPDALRNAKCYAQTFIELSYDIKFNEVQGGTVYLGGPAADTGSIPDPWSPNGSDG